VGDCFGKMNCRRLQVQPPIGVLVKIHFIINNFGLSIDNFKGESKRVIRTMRGKKKLACYHYWFGFIQNLVYFSFNVTEQLSLLYHALISSLNQPIPSNGGIKDALGNNWDLYGF